MKTLIVKREKSGSLYPGLKEVSASLDNYGPGVPIDTINWERFDYKPEVRFNLAYSDKELFLKYYIIEEYVKAEKTDSNQMVCEDSCVEFFVSPGNDGIYYNFEFNPIGTMLLGTGTGRSDRTLAPVSVIDKIRREGSLGNIPFSEKQGRLSWTITAAIPFDVFYRHDLKEIKGKDFRANFYKCGDKLTRPHYLTWNPVMTNNPDFHQSEFFGMLKFE